MAAIGRLRLLGEFALEVEGEEQRLSPSAQRLVALNAVVHGGRRTSRSAVAERLWPDSTPGRAASRLRSVLWRMPRPRGRQLVRSSATDVWLNPEIEVDLWRAEEQAQALQTSLSAPEYLVDLSPLRRDLLPGWHQEWLLVEQESFRQTRLHALERSAQLLREHGRFTDALDAGLGAVKSEPLRESAHRRVIEVHLAEGNHAEALRQYDGYRRLLAAELGLPPSATIRRLVAPLLGRPVDVRPSD
jgi:DNA-binding SARP family transcriptional activator